jgi:hypothetical protein
MKAYGGVEVQFLRLHAWRKYDSYSAGPDRIDCSRSVDPDTGTSASHLKTEADAVSETLCLQETKSIDVQQEESCWTAQMYKNSQRMSTLLQYNV